MIALTKKCWHCNRLLEFDDADVGKLKHCECGAVAYLEIDGQQNKFLLGNVKAYCGYDPMDEREGLCVDDGLVIHYQNGDTGLRLFWLRPLPGLEEIKNGIRVDEGMFLDAHCGCEGQMKVVGILKYDFDSDILSWACEKWDKNEPEDFHETGNCTIARRER